MSVISPPTGLRPGILDAWLMAACGANSLGDLPHKIQACQEAALRATVHNLSRHSVFYRHHLKNFPEPEGLLTCLEDLSLLPLTRPTAIAQWEDLLCVSQSEVARVVSAQSSGTTGPPKRIFFSDADLQRTREFFRVGMSQVVEAGERCLVLLPGGERPHGVADLLRQALPTVHLFAGGSMAEIQPHCLVACPSQLQALLRLWESGEALPAFEKLCAILSSGEPLPLSLAHRLQEAWGCLVLDHYGLTEAGYGGGVECPAHHGYHLRELDMVLEIVDIASGQVLADGMSGEVVLTTLNREAMPLLRYCTGDVAAMLPGPCACGSPLRRLGAVQGRIVRTAGSNDFMIVPLQKNGLGSMESCSQNLRREG